VAGLPSDQTTGMAIIELEGMPPMVGDTNIPSA
jgi:hypothetical protein